VHLDVPAHNYQSVVEGWETHYIGAHGAVISPADGAGGQGVRPYPFDRTCWNGATTLPIRPTPIAQPMALVRMRALRAYRKSRSGRFDCR
jgi:hypothetical protein